MINQIPEPNFNRKWMKLSELKAFFNYQPTQVASLLKSPILIVAKVGKRKFIERDSLDKFLTEKSKN